MKPETLAPGIATFGLQSYWMRGEGQQVSSMLATGLR
jgi:hypothetical protein